MRPMADERVMRSARTLLEFIEDRESRLPKLIAIETAAREIEKLHNGPDADGSTFSLFFGNQSGQRMFAVALFAERTVYVSGKRVTSDTIRRFITENLLLLRKASACIGTWYDPETDLTSLDVVFITGDRKLAARLGKQYNQIGIFDLLRLEFIPTGGSGMALTEAPSLLKRFPRLVRGIK
jgi:hypothetical protein